MSITPTIYAKARAEVLALFGWDADSLSPDQTLRLDCAVALRLAVDDLQGRVIRGESVDMSRMLAASEALSRCLPPAVLASPPPASNAPDPREAMWQTYLSMRRRGELAETYLTPQQRLEAARAKVAEIEAELAAITPSEAEITPPGEIGECYAGMRPGPDDPPKRRPVVIEGKVTSAPPPRATGLLTDNEPEPWRQFATDMDGVPLSTRGKYWAPVGS